MLTLFDVQKEHVAILQAALSKYKFALDSSDTGVGKTVCAVETAKAVGLTPVVVCPKPVISSWESCLKGQGITDYHVFGWEKIRAGTTPLVTRKAAKKRKKPDGTFTKPRVSFSWNLSPDQIVIFDEIHKAKGVKTQNSKLVISAKDAGVPIVGLSATAAEDPKEMRALGYLLGLHSLRNFWGWAQAWGCEFDEYNALHFPQENQYKLKELNKLIYPAHGHKLTRKDLGDHFKECKIITDPITFGDKTKIRKLVEELDEELNNLEERKERDGDDPIPLTKILRLRQEIELLKVPEWVQLIKDARENKLSVTVFANFSETLRAISRRLDEEHGFIWGEQSQKERDLAVNSFQDNSLRILLCNTAAGGVGISLHDIHGGHPRIAFISPTYNPKDFKQTLGRIDRLGGLSESTQRILVADGTLETKIVKRLFEKIENMALLHEKDVDNTDMKETEEPEPEHAEFSPSSLKLVKTCPGYKPREGTNPAAEMGTRVHEALETGDWSRLSDFETSLAQYTVNVEDAIFSESGFSNPRDEKEIRLDINLIGEKTFGTCDRLTFEGSHAIQIDYKTGKYEVDEPGSNIQAKAYMIGTFQKFEQIETIDFYFICSQRDEILFDSFHRDDLTDLVEEVSAIIYRAKQFRQDFTLATIEDLNPTSLVCDYCAMSDRCPAVASKMIEVAQNFGIPPELEVPEIIDAKDETDPEVVSQMLKLIPIIENACEGWKTRAKQMIFDDGVEIPDYEVKTRSGKRTINSPMAAYGLVKDRVELADFLEHIKSYPVMAFEKLVSASAPRGKKKEVVQEIMKALIEDDFVDFSDDVHYLSRVKDKKS